jgi:hypothetical protein
MFLPSSNQTGSSAACIDSSGAAASIGPVILSLFSRTGKHSACMGMSLVLNTNIPFLAGHSGDGDHPFVVMEPTKGTPNPSSVTLGQSPGNLVSGR